jgi:DNA invertase Pin-like site-specific DNA recombinase
MARKRTPAVAYIRVSGKGQVRGGGLPRQRATIRRFAKAGGYVIDDGDWFADEGVSGTLELDNRDGLGALLDRIESNGVRVVLVERADRLARDLVVGELILGQFRERGVRVIEADGANELTAGSDDPTRVLIRQVLGAVAEYDKSVTVAKLRAARERVRRQQGRCEGRKPFGTRPGEQAALERIRTLRQKPRGGDRLSYAAIAETLNREGVPVRRSGKWHPGAVRRIVLREWPALA